MEVIFIILPLAIVLAAAALAAFFWAVHRGQFDDLDTPALRAIFDDPPPTRQGRDSDRISD
ncbi:cbb3-type cytochrome oxidase assembly protein CcoS [Fontivita pretiosa]|uniref:cbb3-type cytochrome oxidase assembly protein CcoS n=1 Tax=Fontivita pretiosa TaxID=2989684 RepID=UPI003D1736CD